MSRKAKNVAIPGRGRRVYKKAFSSIKEKAAKKDYKETARPE